MSRLTENLAKFGLDVTFFYKTGTVCPCLIGGGYGSYSPQWHIDNPVDEDCAGSKLISVTETTKNLRVTANDIRALTNTIGLSSEILDAIGLLEKVDLAVIGTADLDGNYVDVTSYDEHNSYWTINNVRYVTRRVFSQFSNVFEGDLFLVSRKS